MASRPADLPGFQAGISAAFQSPGSLALQVRQAQVALAKQKAEGQRDRLSSLAAPIMLLLGHEGEVYTAKFSPDGSCLASAGYEQKIFFWDVYGECQNFSVLKGHQGSVMELQFDADGAQLLSASTDKTLRVWDMHTGLPVRRFKGHASFVNSCGWARRGPEVVVSGSDDGTVRVWDLRQKDPTHTLQNTYQVTAVCFSDTAEQVFSGGIDNEVKVWDLRQGCQVREINLSGHSDTVTGLALSPDGAHLLSNSMDLTLRAWDIRPFGPKERCVKIFQVRLLLSPDGAHLLSNSMDLTLRAWDIRPFGPKERCVKIFQGHQHNFEKNLLRCAWSPDGHRVTCGSSDRFLYVWDVATRRVLYKLPGHQGSVNDAHFHPKEPIVLSAGSDKKIFLGEIE